MDGLRVTGTNFSPVEQITDLEKDNQMLEFFKSTKDRKIQAIPKGASFLFN